MYGDSGVYTGVRRCLGGVRRCLEECGEMLNANLMKHESHIIVPGGTGSEDTSTVVMA